MPLTEGPTATAIGVTRTARKDGTGSQLISVVRPRPSVEATFQIDVRRLVKHETPAGILRFGESSIAFTLVGNCELRLHWKQGSRETVEQVDLVETLPHFGGRRWWARCPRCRRRVAILNLAAGTHLGCRACLSLAYPSTREGPTARAWRRLFRTRAWLSNRGRKPRGMHWTTYLRRIAAEAAAANALIAELQRNMRRFEARLPTCARQT